MKILLVYESMFGNTEKVATALANALAPYGDVVVTEVGSAPADLDTDLDLLVVGAPTHAFSLSRPNSRSSAAEKSAIVSTGIGVREWLDALPPAPRTPAATFDTRFARPRWLTGSAAHAAAKILRRRGHELIQPPQSFFVTATAGPLEDGQLQRATEWGSALARAVKSTLDRRR